MTGLLSVRGGTMENFSEAKIFVFEIRNRWRRSGVEDTPSAVTDLIESDVDRLVPLVSISNLLKAHREVTLVHGEGFDDINLLKKMGFMPLFAKIEFSARMNLIPYNNILSLCSKLEDLGYATAAFGLDEEEVEYQYLRCSEYVPYCSEFRPRFR